MGKIIFLQGGIKKAYVRRRVNDDIRRVCIMKVIGIEVPLLWNSLEILPIRA